MSKPLSRSSRLIAAMYQAALVALAASPKGQLKKSEVLEAIQANVALDDWALEPNDRGRMRWRSIFGFASVGLVKGGYITTPARSTFQITEEGRAIANMPFEGPKFLEAVRKRYHAWKASQLDTEPPNQVSNTSDEFTSDEVDPPEVRMVTIQRQANEALSAELLETIKACTPMFFESLVVQLLVAMGYGGKRANAGQVTQQSADNGIDGVINEDPLGLDTIYLQAKRWQDPVGEGPVRDFIGALDLKGVKKGVFLTTSHYTPAARLAVQSIKSDKRIVLIDGARLAALMIEHNLGVSTAQTFDLKRLDTDYFAEE